MVSLLVRLPASRRILRQHAGQAALCPKSGRAKNPHTSRWVSVGLDRFCLGSGPIVPKVSWLRLCFSVCAAAELAGGGFGSRCRVSAAGLWAVCRR